MYSARLFVGLWLGFALAIILYAFIDLSVNPWLLSEQGISLTPDLSRIGETLHWGGRLLRQSPVVLIANAAIGGGMLALFCGSVLDKLRGSDEADTERISIYPASRRRSVPPAAS